MARILVLKIVSNRCFFVFDACRANADPVKVEISDEFALGRLLGASWVLLGAAGSLLNVSWVLLGASWVSFGCSLGVPLGVPQQHVVVYSWTLCVWTHQRLYGTVCVPIYSKLDSALPSVVCCTGSFRGLLTFS